MAASTALIEEIVKQRSIVESLSGHDLDVHFYHTMSSPGVRQNAIMALYHDESSSLYCKLRASHDRIHNGSIREYIDYDD